MLKSHASPASQAGSEWLLKWDHAIHHKLHCRTRQAGRVSIDNTSLEVFVEAQRVAISAEYCSMGCSEDFFISQTWTCKLLFGLISAYLPPLPALSRTAAACARMITALIKCVRWVFCCTSKERDETVKNICCKFETMNGETAGARSWWHQYITHLPLINVLLSSSYWETLLSAPRSHFNRFSKLSRRQKLWKITISPIFKSPAELILEIMTIMLTGSEVWVMPDFRNVPSSDGLRDLFPINKPAQFV